MSHLRYSMSIHVEQRSMYPIGCTQCCTEQKNEIIYMTKLVN